MIRKALHAVSYVRAQIALAQATRRHDIQATESAVARMRRAWPDDVMGLFWLARERELAGDRKGAFQVRQEILRISPRDELALRGIAEYWAEKGNPEMACEAIRRALEIDASSKHTTVESATRSLRVVFRYLGRLFGKKNAERKFLKDVRGADRWNRRWHEWAEEYLAVHGTSVTNESDGPVN
jgi:tetratricopeptide (TPR) repeat protein